MELTPLWRPKRKLALSFRKPDRVSAEDNLRSYFNSILVRQSAMSEAREKAKEEVEAYRAQKEAEFQEKQQNVFRLHVLFYEIVGWCRICQGGGGADC